MSLFSHAPLLPSSQRKPGSILIFAQKLKMDPSFRWDDSFRIRRLPLQILTILLLTFASLTTAHAQANNDPTPLQFRDAAEEERLHDLTAELRCVMCQNQSLADSSAPIAHDLRREVLKLMREGKSNGEIKEYLVARYGEFVLYKPSVEPTTWLLWFGPALLLLLGAFVAYRIVSKRGRRDVAAPSEDQEW